MIPLMLAGLGLLAGNQLFADYKKKAREEEVAGQYRGLLGEGPTPMGPPTETGEMGVTGGRGLLADPTDINRQLQFAAGVTGLAGQQGAGLNLLNAAFSRAQQEQGQQQQAGQFAQQFGAGRDDAAAAQARWLQEMEFRRQEAARAANQWGMDFGFRQGEAGRSAEQWRQDFGLRRNADARAAEAAAAAEREAAAKAAGGPELPKLPAGYMYQKSAQDGHVIAAPIEGTPDFAKARETAETLGGALSQIGQMRDLMEGVEQVTPAGKKVRTGGHGTENFGKVRSQYSVLRGQIIRQLGKMDQAGVLQEGEYERYADMIPDPGSFSSNFKFNASMAKAYEEVQNQIDAKLQQHYRAHPWLVPAIPKGFAATN